MGNEIYYCIACGIRVDGGRASGDRAHCAACLGVPPVPPRRESSKRVRKPSSALLAAVAVVEPPPRSSGAPLLLGALALAAAIVAGVALRGPVPQPVEPPPPPPAPVVIAPAPLPEAPAPPASGLATGAAAGKPAPPPAPTVPAVDHDLESRADAAYDSLQEAAGALADEGRFDDALARIRAFPEEFRRARVRTSLEGLRRQIERRAR